MIPWLDLYCRIAPLEAVTQAFNDQEGSREDYYENLLQAALEAGLTDFDTLCALLWYAPWGDARSRAERWIQLQDLISRRIQPKGIQLSPAYQDGCRSNSTNGGAGEGKPIFVDSEVMDAKDTEVPGRSPTLLPVTTESTSISSVTKRKWSLQRGPVFNQAIQEFSSAFNELKDLIRELASQQEQETQSGQDEETLLSKVTQLKTCNKGLVKALSAAAEMQDPFGSGHQKRVAQLSEAIAKEMGLSPDRVEGMKLMGLLHDIGKIAIPPEILSKAGKLNNTESNILKTHPQMGYVLLKDIEFPWPVAQAIHQHHERWDGSGYPSGLSGENIIIEARILAVADVVETMVFPRPYRETVATEKALMEIYKEMGVLYDPLAVQACLTVFVKRDFKFA